MAMMTDQQQQNYKHHCRICRKGFGCGRALGGHMRAHGINEDAAAGEQGDADDDPPAGGGGGAAACSPCGSGGGNRRMYALRGSSNRLRTCRVCENCGMEFSSWKGFLEHGRCNYGCDGSLASASAAAAADEEEEEEDDDEEEEEEEEEEEGERRECVGWSKGKRSRRSKTAAGGGGLSSQEEDLASCLVLLSAGRVDPGCAAAVVVETEESCASASKEDRRSSADRTANFLAVEKPKAAVAPPKGMFECKACKKVFSSHQALGGHRASHKKVKGCFAAKLDDLEEAPPEEEPMVAAIAGDGATAVVPFVAAPMRKKKLHECSVCHRVFTSGQALGGHKRCHWLTSNAADQSSSMARLHHMQTQQAKPLLQLRPMNEPLDLNLPAPPEAAAAPLGLDVPALFLQAWMENDNVEPPAAITTNSINKKISASHVEDEAESNVKLAKFSDLKDLNMRGVSTSWLQVGLGSSSKESHKP